MKHEKRVVYTTSQTKTFHWLFNLLSAIKLSARYEKSSSEQNESVSSILGPVPCKDVGESKEISKCDLKELDGSVQAQVNFQNSVFNDCNIGFWVKKD